MSADLLPLLLALPLTLAIEIPLACWLGVRKKSDLLLVAMVNCITNPLLNGGLTLAGAVSRAAGVIVPALLIGETLVVLSEGWFVRRFLASPPHRPFLFSLALNAASFLLGGAALRLLAQALLRVI